MPMCLYVVCVIFLFGGQAKVNMSPNEFSLFHIIAFFTFFFLIMSLSEKASGILVLT